MRRLRSRGEFLVPCRLLSWLTASAVAVGATTLPIIRLILSAVVPVVAVLTPVRSTTIAVLLKAGLVLPATLVATLERVTQALVLTLVAGGQSLEQLLHVRDLRCCRDGTSQPEHRCHNDKAHPVILLTAIATG